MKESNEETTNGHLARRNKENKVKSSANEELYERGARRNISSTVFHGSLNCPRLIGQPTGGEGGTRAQALAGGRLLGRLAAAWRRRPQTQTTTTTTSSSSSLTRANIEGCHCGRRAASADRSPVRQCSKEVSVRSTNHRADSSDRTDEDEEENNNKDKSYQTMETVASGLRAAISGQQAAAGGKCKATGRQVSGPIWLLVSTALPLLLLLLLTSSQSGPDPAHHLLGGSRAGGVLVAEAANVANLQHGSVVQQQQQQSQQQQLQVAKANGAAASLQQQQQQQQQQAAAQNKQSQAVANSELFPQASSREIEKQIVDKILGEGYDKRIRPAGSGPYNASRPGSDGPTIVQVNTLVRSISKIDDVTMEYSVQLSLRQEWTDDRLAFGKMPQYRNYGLNSITLTEQERLWKPDLFFRNEKEGHFHKIIMPNVLLRIKGEGQVLYSIRISLVLACPMDLKYYPLDKQNCTIEMASYGYLDEDLKFTWKSENPVQIAKPLNLPRFTLETYGTAYCTSRTTTGAYSCLRIDLIFKREFSYYLIQIYIPCCMLVIVSWVSFWLDPNAIPARVSLGVTTLLTMATQISGINASLPPVSYTKAIDVWTGVCLTFVFGALLEFALVNYASRSDQHKREMLTSALTHTQQMRWREAVAAAAAAGTAPPTSPPPDENSPSMLATKQPAFFGSLLPLGGPHCAHTAVAATTGAYSQPSVGGAAHQGRQPPVTSCPGSIGDELHFKSVRGNNATGTITRSGTSATGGRGAGVATVDGPSGGRSNGKMGNLAGMTPGSTINRANNGANHNGGVGLGNNCNPSTKITTNCALQYLKSPREVHLMSPKPPGRKNWCKMWLAKFPTRSKRIDVISRIFFPLKFALFNLVYWTTYLFREEDTVA